MNSERYHFFHHLRNLFAKVFISIGLSFDRVLWYHSLTIIEELDFLIAFKLFLETRAWEIHVGTHLALFNRKPFCKSISFLCAPKLNVVRIFRISFGEAQSNLTLLFYCFILTKYLPIQKENNGVQHVYTNQITYDLIKYISLFICLVTDIWWDSEMIYKTQRVSSFCQETSLHAWQHSIQWYMSRERDALRVHACSHCILWIGWNESKSISNSKSIFHMVYPIRFDMCEIFERYRQSLASFLCLTI